MPIKSKRMFSNTPGLPSLAGVSDTPTRKSLEQLQQAMGDQSEQEGGAAGGFSVQVITGAVKDGTSITFFCETLTMPPGSKRSGRSVYGKISI